MRAGFNYSFLFIGFLFLSPISVFAEEENLPPAPEFVGYDASPLHPFGRPHPEAPDELKQFHFMIGENACIDRVLGGDGKWREFPARWNAHYFLNGYGIQDEYWADTFGTSNLRIFDSKIGKWQVTFFSMPRYGSGVWLGKKEGDDLVMRQFTENAEGKTVESRLTFFEITQTSFEWRGANVLDGSEPLVTWTSSCRKVF